MSSPRSASIGKPEPFEPKFDGQGLISAVAVDAGSGEVWSCHELDGNGLQALFLSGAGVLGEKALLSADGDGPFPSRPVVAAVRGDEPVTFDLGRDRRLSSNFLFPERKPDDERPSCPFFSTARDLPLKLPPGYWRPSSMTRVEVFSRK